MQNETISCTSVQQKYKKYFLLQYARVLFWIKLLCVTPTEDKWYFWRDVRISKHVLRKKGRFRVVGEDMVYRWDLSGAPAAVHLQRRPYRCHRFCASSGHNQWSIHRRRKPAVGNSVWHGGSLWRPIRWQSELHGLLGEILMNASAG